MGERMIRVEDRVKNKLGHTDAQTLMEYSRAGDERILSLVGDRLNEFRSEVRDGFNHSDKEHSAAIFRSNAEMEARLMAAIAAAQPSKSNGLHPAGIAVGGMGLGGALLYAAMSVLGGLPGS